MWVIWYKRCCVLGCSVYQDVNTRIQKLKFNFLSHFHLLIFNPNVFSSQQIHYFPVLLESTVFNCVQLQYCWNKDVKSISHHYLSSSQVWWQLVRQINNRGRKRCFLRMPWADKNREKRSVRESRITYSFVWGGMRSQTSCILRGALEQE